jgi:hypothetical protein
MTVFFFILDLHIITYLLFFNESAIEIIKYHSKKKMSNFFRKKNTEIFVFFRF